MPTPPAENPKQVKGKRRYNDAGERWCTRCKAFLPVASFGAAPNIADGLNIYCKTCHAKKHKAWCDENRDEVRTRHAREMQRWREQNREHHNAVQRERRRKLRLEVLAAYGNHCMCCGETTPEFLSLDHINNDGKQHRAEVGMGINVYLWAKKNGYPPTLQLLCFNCNLSKGFFGMCPHQRE